MTVNTVILKCFATVVLAITLLIINNSALAKPQEIVLFYADWSVKSRTARAQLNSLAKELNIQLKELNIDKTGTSNEAEKIGVKVPSKVPYIYIMDKGGQVIKSVNYYKLITDDLKNDIFKLSQK